MPFVYFSRLKEIQYTVNIFLFLFTIMCTLYIHTYSYAWKHKLSKGMNLTNINVWQRILTYTRILGQLMWLKLKDWLTLQTWIFDKAWYGENYNQMNVKWDLKYVLSDNCNWFLDTLVNGKVSDCKFSIQFFQFQIRLLITVWLLVNFTFVLKRAIGIYFLTCSEYIFVADEECESCFKQTCFMETKKT